MKNDEIMVLAGASFKNHAEFHHPWLMKN